MDLRTFDPDDRSALLAHNEVVNAVRAADSPWEHPRTEHETHGALTHGWDGEPPRPWLGTVDGVPVAAGAYATSEWDNQHLAWLDVLVHPEHRRQGHGTALLEALLDRARAEGRTSVGASGWDSPTTRSFAERHGFAVGSVAVNRRQHLAEVDRGLVERLHAEAASRAAAYDLVRYDGPLPEAELEAMAVAVAAINDAPTDDLDIEDEQHPPARLRAYEDAQRARGIRLYRVVARHRATGLPAGQTVVGVDGERPHLAEQHDTSVVAAHRGHRLGLLLKTAMLLWLAEVEPQVELLDTWNAESNDHMIGVNEALGYRVLGRALELQRTV